MVRNHSIKSVIPVILLSLLLLGATDSPQKPPNRVNIWMPQFERPDPTKHKAYKETNPCEKRICFTPVIPYGERTVYGGRLMK